MRRARTGRADDVRRRTIGIGLIGFGTIGTGVVRVLRERSRDIEARLGCRLRLVRIADLDTRSDRGVRVPKGVLGNDANALIEDPAVDIVVELIGGREPALSFLRRALQAGKPAVTANKALLSTHGLQLARVAERKGVGLGYEASVGGGIPILRSIREGLAADKNREVYGIVNGTANYILSEMTAHGGEFSQVLAKAQSLGLAEADSRYDVDGIDSLHKLVVLVAVAFGKKIDPRRVHVEGIRHIAPTDIAYAEEFGYTIKLLAVARDGEDGVEARVHPTMVPNSHLLSKVSGAFNAIALESAALGTSLYYGQGAGMMPTAAAVVADVVESARSLLAGEGPKLPPYGMPAERIEPARVLPMSELVHEHYLRFRLADRPGVLAKIASILGREGVGIATVAQRQEEAVGGAVPVVMRTHRAREGALERALRRVASSRECRARPVSIRVEERLGSGGRR